MSAVTPVAIPDSAPRPSLPARARLDSIDLLRGLVMIVMALDHVRDYFTNFREDPADPAKSPVGLFLTRWITHFCAPTFVFLAGTGAYIYGTRHTRSELSRFLWTRGLWLVILEVTIVRFGLFFDVDYRFTLLQVLWAIGWSMVLLAGAVWLPVTAIAAIGALVTLLHNAVEALAPQNPVMIFLNGAGMLPLGGGHAVIAAYPVLPWFGIMALGYACGPLFFLDAPRRRGILIRLGAGALAIFAVLRVLGVYGDPAKWTIEASPVRTVLSFIAVTKYPVSLEYALLTVGCAVLFLALLPATLPRWTRPFVIYGRVPLFYYLLHFYLIHVLAFFNDLWQTGTTKGLHGGIPNSWPGTETPASYGYNLPVVYLIWILVVASLYPLCVWFAGVKQRRREAWLSYF